MQIKKGRTNNDNEMFIGSDCLVRFKISREVAVDFQLLELRSFVASNISSWKHYFLMEREQLKLFL